MARHSKSGHAAPRSRKNDHATYAALTARLTAFQTELSTQAKSHATHDAPPPTLDMAVSLIAQMSRLMHHAPEVRGLPQIPSDRPVTVSELSVAFAQTRHAFDAFGKRMGYDQPVADAESERRLSEFRNDVSRMINARIVMGIQSGYLGPLSNKSDTERLELASQFQNFVDRLGLIVDAEALVDMDEKWF